MTKQSLEEIRHAILHDLLMAEGIVGWSVSKRSGPNGEHYYFKENGDFFADIVEHDSGGRRGFTLKRNDVVSALENRIQAGKEAKKELKTYLKHFGDKDGKS